MPNTQILSLDQLHTARTFPLPVEENTDWAGIAAALAHAVDRPVTQAATFLENRREHCGDHYAIMCAEHIIRYGKGTNTGGDEVAWLLVRPAWYREAQEETTIPVEQTPCCMCEQTRIAESSKLFHYACFAIIAILLVGMMCYTIGYEGGSTNGAEVHR